MDKKMDMLCELMDCIVEDAKHNKDSYSIEQMGEITDMIKDLAEAKEKCYKACYYKEIYEAMKEEKHPERMGYDHYRYASGRFAPTGRGHRTGYTHPFMMDEIDEWDMSGYTQTGGGNRSQPGSRSSGGGSAQGTGRMGYPMSDYGRHYDEWDNARRHYHESRSTDDKKRMNDHATEHLEESIASMKEIWKESDPELKQKMKQSLTKMVEDMR